MFRISNLKVDINLLRYYVRSLKIIPFFTIDLWFFLFLILSSLIFYLNSTYITFPDWKPMYLEYNTHNIKFNKFQFFTFLAEIQYVFISFSLLFRFSIIFSISQLNIFVYTLFPSYSFILTTAKIILYEM